MREQMQEMAEKYLGAPIPPCLYAEAERRALRKLDWIISREGDADGERRKPYYLAQLIAEAVKSMAFSAMCYLDYEDKKRNARAKHEALPNPAS